MAFPSYEAWAAANGQTPTPQMRNDAQAAGKPYTKTSTGGFSGGLPASTYQSAWEAKQQPSNNPMDYLSPYTNPNAPKTVDQLVNAVNSGQAPSNLFSGATGGLGGLGGLGGMQQPQMPDYSNMMQQQQQMYQQMMQQQQQAMQAQNQSMQDMMSNWSKGFGAQQGSTYNPTGVGGSFSNVQSPVYRSDGTMDGGRAPRNGYGGMYGGDGPFRSTF